MKTTEKINELDIRSEKMYKIIGSCQTLDQLSAAGNMLKFVGNMPKVVLSLFVVRRKEITRKQAKRKKHMDGEYIAKKICESFKISYNLLKSRARNRNLVMIRQCAMYYLRLNTRLSLSEIGGIFNRDHATVLYSVRTVKSFLEIRNQEFTTITDKINTVL